ncbi:bifunctional precorrin-2 dehydrogenase/sirohydrochlorin ferrochelatase [Desulfococcus sp.]|uniref:precorrin-2 dehydrogenase/sirohydrochlorin ferrochelatase family protein n=1 Tax=Desulfococcus sp. TaxID=2025834 RepID=UPI00359483A0
MPVYPINLNVQDRLCVVVGGGAVGARKALLLVRCGARVTVVSPEVTDALRPDIDSGAVCWRARGYCSVDLAPGPFASLQEGGAPEETASVSGAVFLVIAATDNPAVNARVGADARRRGVLCNIADRPEACDFTLPAVVSRGDLTITVSTSGRSPALARKLRKELETLLGEEYAVGLRLMGAVRKKLLGEGRDPETHKIQFRRVIDGGLISLIKEGRFAEVDRLLLDALGEGYTFDSLMKAV